MNDLIKKTTIYMDETKTIPSNLGNLTILMTDDGIDSLRVCDVYIDNKLVGLLGKGDGFSIDLSTENHTIFLKMGLCSTQKLNITIRKDTTSYLVAGNFLNLVNSLPILKIFAPKKYIYLKPLIMEEVLDSYEYKNFLTKKLFNTDLTFSNEHLKNINANQDDLANAIHFLLSRPNDSHIKELSLKNLKARSFLTGFLFVIAFILINIRSITLSNTITNAIIAAFVFGIIPYFLKRKLYTPYTPTT